MGCVFIFKVSDCKDALLNLVLQNLEIKVSENLENKTEILIA